MALHTGEIYTDFATLAEVPVGATIRVTEDSDGARLTTEGVVVSNEEDSWLDARDIQFGSEEEILHEFVWRDFVELEVLEMPAEPEKTFTATLPDVGDVGVVGDAGGSLKGVHEIHPGWLTVERSVYDRDALFLDISGAGIWLTHEDTLKLAAMAAKVAGA